MWRGVMGCLCVRLALAAARMSSVRAATNERTKLPSDDEFEYELLSVCLS